MAVTPENELIAICQGDGFTPSYDPGDRALVAQYGERVGAFDLLSESCLAGDEARSIPITAS